nr:MAG TPA: hypothetical protein [Caudoviricetes sp.]
MLRLFPLTMTLLNNYIKYWIKCAIFVYKEILKRGIT